MYIGIDGGGTKTKFTVINEFEEVIYTVEKGTCHYNQVGFTGLESIILDGLNDILNKLNIKIENINGVCLGLAGYGKVKEDADKVSEIIKKIFKDVPYKLLNDVEIAHSAALGLEDGIVIIAGTGSIGYSVNKDVSTRVGGWGYGIGDEGSAYWIGRKVLEEFSKQADGRAEKTQLYNLLKEELKLEDDYQLIKYVYSDIKCNRTEVAKLAKVCDKAARLGDLEAIKIFDNAGSELSALINTLSKEFSKEENIKASYVGGVFRCGDFIINPIKENLNSNIEFLHPKYTPDLGACLIAKKLNKGNK